MVDYVRLLTEVKVWKLINCRIFEFHAVFLVITHQFSVLFFLNIWLPKDYAPWGLFANEKRILNKIYHD